jgi:hypothetical protein
MSKEKDDTEHGIRSLKLLPRLVQEKRGLRLHRSIPSARISCIKGLPSSYEPAR